MYLSMAGLWIGSKLATNDDQIKCVGWNSRHNEPCLKFQMLMINRVMLITEPEYVRNDSEVADFLIEEVTRNSAELLFIEPTKRPAG